MTTCRRHPLSIDTLYEFCNSGSMMTTRQLIGLFAVLCLQGVAFGQGGFNGPGRYEIANLQSGKVLDLDRNDQTTVIQFSPRGADNQTWDVVPADGGYYVLRNGMNGNALEVVDSRNSSPLRGTRFHGGPSQQWRIESSKDGNALIVSRIGKAIDVPDGSNRDGIKMQIYDRNGDENQRFIFRSLGRGRDDRIRDRVRDRVDRRVDNGRAGAGYYDDRDRMWRMQGDGVCFYQQPDYRGEAYCSAAGEDRPMLPRGLNNAFSSVKFFGRARSVEVYDLENFDGQRYRIQRDEPDLGRLRNNRRDSLSNRISSFRVD